MVFSKYYAFHVPEPVPLPEATDTLPPASSRIIEEHQPPEFANNLEVKQILRDLQQRFNELEFERVERRSIRSDVKALDERLQESFGRISERQEKIEQCIAELADLPPQPTLEDLAELRSELRALDVESARLHIERVEGRLQLFTEERSAGPDAPTLELLSRLDARLTEVEGRLANLAQAKSAASTAGLQLDFALKELAELKAALQNVSVRYTEIGELKKNHLVLRNLLDSLQQSVDNSREEFKSGNAARIAELEKEVLALRAEVRRTYERLELLETQPPEANPPFEPVPPGDVVSLKEQVAAVSKHDAEQHERMQSELNALEATVKEAFRTHAELPEKLESVSSQARCLEQQSQQLARTIERLDSASTGMPQKIMDLGRDVSVLREELLQVQAQMHSLHARFDDLESPVPVGTSTTPQADMHVIRENLDEIRRFMIDLSRKK